MGKGCMHMHVGGGGEDGERVHACGGERDKEGMHVSGDLVCD